MKHQRINVTKTFLPPIEEYQAYLDKIWRSGQLTNQGPLVKEFEKKTEEYLGVSNFHFVSNGTLALQLALSALGIDEGEVITTPFSYVATTSAILWERCKPVFVDVDKDSLCIDPDKIEAAITPNTKAILGVHVFGRPCDVEKIDIIAKKHNLKVIYDGAHAFGVTYKGKSLLSYGDISICSFHSTKLFHTIEGGCLVAKNKEIGDRIELIKRFGHDADDHYVLGINAKASEFQAAMGLCNLNYIDDQIEKRKKIHELYDELLSHAVVKPRIRSDTQHNYVYYPVVLNSEDELHSVTTKLNEDNIFPRRYFYPSLNKLPYITSDHPCPIAEDISTRILCLPFYPDIGQANIRRISNIFNSTYAT